MSGCDCESCQWCADCGGNERIVDEDNHLCARCTGLTRCWSCSEWFPETQSSIWGPMCQGCIEIGDQLYHCCWCQRLYDGTGMFCKACLPTVEQHNREMAGTAR